jgi:hypothetical protein
MKRVLYLIYYFKSLDHAKYQKFAGHVKQLKGWSSLGILLRVVYAVFRYNISILEYFQFHFYDLSHSERLKWAGTGYMYEYQLLMNPKKHRSYLEDKRVFLEKFKAFVQHQHVSLEALRQDKGLSRSIFVNASGKMVLKSHNGQCGWGVEVLDAQSLNEDTLIAHLEETGNDLVEEYIVQHPDLMRLSPSGLNTVRIFTQLNAKDEVELLGCRLRITVNSHVDNMAAGNIAAPIDDDTGKLTGPGVYSDITKEDEFEHPVTHVPIVGFQIPFWHETVEMVKKAALSFPECRSIGWDVAITEKGPELIEGNHNWCKLLWQLPVKAGMKSTLSRYL